MARKVTITRDQAELLVNLLEKNYSNKDPLQPSGVGADFAEGIRAMFGMVEQPRLVPYSVRVDDPADLREPTAKSRITDLLEGKPVWPEEMEKTYQALKRRLMVEVVASDASNCPRNAYRILPLVEVIK